ncbi:MAG: hypothetical protein ABUR63_05400 [Verrucomicrobiota bacterium]
MRARSASRTLASLLVLPFACSTGGSSSTGGSGSGASGATHGTGGSSADQSVLERNNHPSRDGVFVQPRLTKAVAATLKLESTFKATFAGNMWASPLYLQNGPGKKGVFFAVTTGNDVFALDETSGATVWTKNLGSSPTANGVSCGNIHPLGILSTPVISASARTIYVGAAIGTNSISDHQIHALSVDDGSPKPGWPVSVSKVTSAGMTFMPPPQNQRSALSLVGGKVYVAYGGHVGDCGPYHGWVVAVDATDPTKVGGWVTGGQGEGIWDAGGMASDGNGVFALTGNSTVGASTHLDSEEAVRITGMGTKSDAFFPTSWKSMDSGDADLGASNPVYFELPGATPSKVLAVVSKDGNIYLLDAENLGGMGGQKAALQVSNGTMSIHTAVATYTTGQGRYVVFGTDSGALCASASGEAIVSVRVAAGSPPKPAIAWCAPLSGPVTGPVTTTTDGTRDVVVWYMSNGKLVGVDGDAGSSIFTSTESCAGVRQWTSPIAVNGRIVVGADGKLCAWSAP